MASAFDMLIIANCWDRLHRVDDDVHRFNVNNGATIRYKGMAVDEFVIDDPNTLWVIGDKEVDVGSSDFIAADFHVEVVDQI